MGMTVITMVTDAEMWVKNVVNSFREYTIDFIPCFNVVDASVSLNGCIEKSRNDLIIICHQDVIFPQNALQQIQDQLNKLNDDNFGVVGTYGKIGGKGLGNIWNPKPRKLKGIHPLPHVASVVDEHCMIIRKSSGLRFDEELKGFHLYGADLCLQAEEKGLKNYVIDLQVEHLSPYGNTGDKYQQAIKWFVEKWKGRCKYKIYPTLCCEVNFETGNWNMYI